MIVDRRVQIGLERLFVFVGMVFFLSSCSSMLFAQRFRIDEGKFALDGKPFQIISGEIHYARTPEAYWRDRLLKAKAMGLNTVSTYVFWNFHQPKPGEFMFKGRADVARFVRIAQEVGLWVILRPGPYACAEWEFGGYPSWLLKDRNLKIRSSDEQFLRACEQYLDRLGQELAPLQIDHGGPIILVQVGNEYGSFGKDTVYERKIRDIIRGAGFNVPLFTADGPSQCKNAHLADVLPAINGEENPQSIIDTVNMYNRGKGPYFSPEFYPGWLDHWGETHSVSPVDEFIGKYDTLLMRGISVSLYMFHGGTNFGFMNGANYGGRYQPQPTSYDYDAPLDEAGRPTPKYYKLRDVIARHLPQGTQIPEVPISQQSIEIPRFNLTESTSVLNVVPQPVRSLKPLTFEDIGQSYGYILYRTRISSPDSGKLVISGLRDYGIVLLNGKRIGSLDRRYKQSSVTMNVTVVPSVLDIFIENGGRINYGHEMLDNRKGITGNVTFDGKVLENWEIYPLPLDDISAIRFASTDVSTAPTFYRGAISIARAGDTFLDMRGWGKGCVWVNRQCLGRYWHIGPQQTLYLPGAWLKEGENEIVIFELEDGGKRSVQGLRDPILDQLEPDNLKPSLPPRLPGNVRLDRHDLVAEGSFTNDHSAQNISFTPAKGRFVCLQSLSSQENDLFASVAELNLFDEGGSRMARDHWKVVTVDCEELTAEDGHAENAFDDDPETIWHTTWSSSKPNHPHYIVIDTGGVEDIGGFSYLARNSDAPGRIKDFKFYVRTSPFEMTK